MQIKEPLISKQPRKDPWASFRSKAKQSKEEAKNTEECLKEHSGDIVNVGDDLSHTCRMCNTAFSQLGFKCTICLATYYCTECRKFDTDMKINDGTG